MKRQNRNPAPHILSSCALAIFVFSFSALAAVTVPQYRAKIHDAKQSVDILIYSDVEDSNLLENKKLEAGTLKKIRASLPASEKVEWQSTSNDVENGWILEKLGAFENERNSTRRKTILTEISDRLGAIEAKLNELEQAAPAGRTKDENKQKLSEILNRAEYRKPEEKQENFLQRLWREFKEWLSRVFPRPSLGAPSGEGLRGLSSILQIVIFGVVFALIGFIIYKFAPFIGAKFKNREKKAKSVRVILGEQLAEDETSDNLFSDAEALAREGQLKAAIRKGYIALLCELSDRKIIGLARHKTNRDYLRDVRGMSGELHQNMSGLTGAFERHWYGSASTEEKDWEDFRQKYKQTIKN